MEGGYVAVHMRVHMRVHMCVLMCVHMRGLIHFSPSMPYMHTCTYISRYQCMPTTCVCVCACARKCVNS